MKICIASYERHETICNKSLKVLLNAGYQPTEIDLFVANEEQYHKYKNVVPEGINIIIAVKGLKNVREFIFNYYDEGEHVLSLDDDIESVKYFDIEQDKIVEIVDFKNMVETGFNECQKKGLKLWGLYSVSNKLFMKQFSEITYDYKFIIGNFFGFINCKKMNSLNVSNIDDYERSIKSYLLYSGSVRMNRYVCKTNFKKNAGGAQCDPDRQSKIYDDMNLLLKLYPDLLHLRRRKNGINPLLKDQRKISLNK